MATSPNFHQVRSKLQNRKLEIINNRDVDIFESGLAIRPENPHFVWRLRTRKINDVHIPITVIDCYQLKIPNNISVVDERGKEWDVRIFKMNRGGMVCSRTHWSRLCEANLVRTGDACICEFMQGHIGLYIRVRVIRANELRSRDIFESGLAVEPENPYFVWRPTRPKNMTLRIPQKIAHRYNLKTGNCLTLVDERGNKWETSFVAMSSREVGCSSTGWRKLCDANVIRIGDRCICEFIQEISGVAMHVRVVRAQAYIHESGMELNISKVKRKLRSPSSHAPVRRSARKDNTLDQKKVIEEEKIKIIDEETLDLDPPEESGWKIEDAQQRAIENRKDDSLQIHGTSIGSSECLPEKLEQLQSYFQLVGEQAVIPIDLHNDVFGKKYKICILHEHVNKFCLLEPIADCCIISYMGYLHRKMKIENLLHRFKFVNPNYISHQSTREERARALADRLIGALTNQLVLAPCNVGFHWILTVIEPYKKTVFLLDPLSHRIRDETWRDAVNDALSMFSASKGDKQEKLSRWVIVKAHLQPDSKQCGFYIMRYMKQIIEACRNLGSISLESMFTKDGYSTSEIDEMRIEWVECILDHIG